MLENIRKDLLSYIDKGMISGMVPFPYIGFDINILLQDGLIEYCPENCFRLTFKGHVVLAKKRHDDALKCCERAE